MPKVVLIQIKIKTGLLTINNFNHLSKFVSFGSRINKKRGFFFISKVMGKHLPTKPSVMEETFLQMSNIIPKSDEATLYIGFAEAAVGLGEGVFEKNCSNKDSFYIHSTRFYTSQKPLLAFEEMHSHAKSHILYKPYNENWLKNITRIVLIDDEISTGKTAENIILKLKPLFPKVSNYILVSIVDFSDNTNITSFSLCKSKFTFEKNDFFIQKNIVSQRDNTMKLDAIIPNNFGRYGVKKLHFDFEKMLDISPLLDKKILVLGTGEFTYPPYLLAKYLEEKGSNVFCQSTTRSPINIDGDISSVLQFKDNYHESIDNFLYNVMDREYDTIIVCYETVKKPQNFTLIKQLEKKFNIMELFFGFKSNCCLSNSKSFEICL